MFAEAREEHAPEWSAIWPAIQAVADPLGIGTVETVRRWVRHSEIDTRARASPTSEESAELQRLHRENTELGRDNAILDSASAFFTAEIDRPHR